ncbi:MAG: PIN domain-containing protein [Methylophaga sp.]|nr:PIN domain-containing protein [Methylophaga sp.]
MFTHQIIQKRWQIVPFGKNVIKNSIDLAIKNNLDLEDVLQCLCARENGCMALITNDNNFVNCGLSICTIVDFPDFIRQTVIPKNTLPQI